MKIKFFLMIAVLAVLLCACNDTSAKNNSTKPQPSATENSDSPTEELDFTFPSIPKGTLPDDIFDEDDMSPIQTVP